MPDLHAASGHPMRLRILASAMAGYALVMMGLVPVNTIMPDLATHFGVPLGTAAWLLTGYLLAMTSLILPAGRLGDRLGHRVVYVWGLAGYIAACALAGLAGGFWTLLAARGVQGLTSALVLGTTLAMVTNAFPAHLRGRAVGAITLASYVGGGISSYLAAWAIQSLTWRWVFWALVPPGLLALGLALTIRDPAPAAPRERRPIDWTGTILLAAALVSFSLGLNHLHDGSESWADGWRWHLPMHGLAAVFFYLFVRVQQRAPEPLVPLHNLKNRAFVAALGANLILHMTMLGALGAVPFLVQLGLGLTPAYTATVLVFLNLLSVTMAPVSGWLYDRTDSRLLLPGTMLMLGSGMLLFGLAGLDLTFAGLLGLCLYMGTGMGLFTVANNAALMGAVPAEIRGFASGMLETTRQMGHGIASTLVGSILSAGVALAGQGAGGRAVLAAAMRTHYFLMAGVAGLGVLCAIWYGMEKDRRLQSGTTAVAPTGD